VIPFNRVRFSNFSAADTSEVTYSPNCPGLTNTSVNNGLSYVLSDVAAGFKNPLWRTQVRNGTQAGTPYTREVFRVVEDDLFTMEYRQKAQFAVCPESHGFHSQQLRMDRRSRSCFDPNALNHLPDQIPRAESQANARLRTAIREEYEHMNSLITLAEGRQAVAQLRRPYKAVQDQILKYLDSADVKLKNLRGRNPSKWKKLAKARRDAEMRNALAESWLETTFGLVPTLSDAKAATEALARFINGSATRRSAVKGYGEAVSYSSPGPSTAVLGGHFRATRNIRTTTTDTVVYRAGLRLDTVTNMTDFGRLKDVYGFQPRNFLPTLYEVIPYSWLVDYFTTLGSAINLNTISTAKVLWVVKSTKRRTVRESIWVPDFSVAMSLGSQYAGGSGRTGKNVYERTTVARETLVGDVIPYIVPRVKSFSEVNPLQASNILALVQVKLGRVRGTIKLLRV
jgi:hypothetical protein